jgi:hypothetical protein
VGLLQVFYGKYLKKDLGLSEIFGMVKKDSGCGVQDAGFKMQDSK